MKFQSAKEIQAKETTINENSSIAGKVRSKNTDEQYMADMIHRHLPLVKVIVAKMRPNLPSHADCEELHSAGVVGLISAIERFDPSRGFCFETYASIRVRGAILDELRKLDIMPRSARSNYRKLKKTVEILEQKLGRAPSDREIWEEMGLTPQKYRKMRANTQPCSMVFLDKTRDADELNLHDLVADDRLTPCHEMLEQEELTVIINEKIQKLPGRQKMVLAFYYYEGMRLAEIGNILGVSEARVSQLRSQALKSLRIYLNRIINY